MKNTLMKIADLAILAIAVLAALGGTAYLFADRHILFGITNLCLAGMAFPFVKKIVQDMFKQ